MKKLTDVSPKSLAYAVSILRWHHALDRGIAEDVQLIADFLEGQLKAKASVELAIDKFPEVKQLLTASANMLRPLEDMAYPEKDVYGHNGNKGKAGERGCDMPFWSEGGLYPRVGKEAARTLLSRRTDLENAFLTVSASKLLNRVDEGTKCDPS